MNILFFLTPKCDVAFLEEDNTLRQALEKMEFHRYSTIPVLAKDGSYLGTMTEGDLLWEIKNHHNLNLKEAENIAIRDVKRHRDNQPVSIDADMENLFNKVVQQNFVPVIDGQNTFIGIVTRKEVITYLKKLGQDA